MLAVVLALWAVDAWAWPFAVPPTDFPGITCWYTLGQSPDPDGNPEAHPMLQVDHRQLHNRNRDDRWTPVNRFHQWPGEFFQIPSQAGKVVEVRYWWQDEDGNAAELDPVGPDGQPLYHDLGTRLCE